MCAGSFFGTVRPVLGSTFLPFCVIGKLGTESWGRKLGKLGKLESWGTDGTFPFVLEIGHNELESVIHDTVQWASGKKCQKTTRLYSRVPRYFGRAKNVSGTTIAKVTNRQSATIATSALERIFQCLTKLIIAGMSQSMSRQQLIIPAMEKTGWICVKLKPTA